MKPPRVLVLRSPGTNCDLETAFAFEAAGAQTEQVHLNRLIENPSLATRYQILCIPGGFSFGDDIAAGRILAVRLQRHLTDVVQRFATDDRLVLGICNGMQVLMRLGLLTADDLKSEPTGSEACEADKDPSAADEAATLTWNDHGRFENRWVHLQVPTTPCVFLRGLTRLFLPVAHAQGKFVVASENRLQQWERSGRLALRYCSELADDPSSNKTILPFPSNPNGSEANVAGLCDASGRIFGLMPHPERYIDPTHHPFWTRLSDNRKWGDGYPLFRNAVEYFA